MTLLQQINRIARHPITLLLIRVVVGGIFIAFAIAKVFEPREDFYAIVANYQMLPNALIPVFANVVILAELVAGIMFLIGLFPRWSGYAMLGLLTMFMIAIAQTLVRGISLADCGCSGSFISIGEGQWEVLFRDGVMFIGVVWVLYTKSTALTIDRWLDRSIAKPATPPQS